MFIRVFDAGRRVELGLDKLELIAGALEIRP
jgi:hypothetical protein